MNKTSQSNLPVVSVVIPTYNRSKELVRAIKSVLNQTFQNFEILVVDDGSEDDLKSVCNSFNDPRIRFLRNDIHSNANVARNRGIQEAKGEYIAMLDSDDEYLPHHLNRRIEKIKEWECDGIFGSAYVDDDEGLTLKLSRPLRKGELMINYLLSDGFAPTPSHFYRTNSAKEILWNESLLRHQDYDFSIRFTEKFEFRSDYEPTHIIHWSKNLSQKKYYWENCYRFIDIHKNKVDPKILFRYFAEILSISKASNAPIDISLRRRIVNDVESITNFISFTDYIHFRKESEKYHKFNSLLRYSLLLFKTLF